MYIVSSRSDSGPGHDHTLSAVRLHTPSRVTQNSVRLVGTTLWALRLAAEQLGDHFEAADSRVIHLEHYPTKLYIKPI
jgi:hypothetical protein